jgi:hypothetical protein
MNKQDIKLIIVLVFLALCLIILFSLLEKKENKVANVYYKDDLILTIDLTKELTEYTVMGENGKVKIVAGEGKVKVEEENSPKHLCSKQGYITSSLETIVCLPNKIVIEISSKEELDTVVK